MIEALLRDIDAAWAIRSPTKIRLRIIGSTALMLQCNYSRGTKDSDVLETADIVPDVRAELERLAGRETVLHKRHRRYVDIVAAALPFLPCPPRCHDLTKLSESLAHFDVEVLDIVDVVVSKLKRFSPSDRGDIDAMIHRGLIPHGVLVDRFERAAAAFEMSADAEDLPKYLANLNAVERDMLLVAPTKIALPPWVTDD